ncbi:MAG TPA: pyridoxamine 5'-phosphate oxidase family protein [Acidimicrobiales bacterium]|nr:pyridoxamine 5'-phosphate oxidase family protein [Acidimicrobiales bacterium]
MSVEPPRPTAERVRHVLARLATDVDLWVATAAPDGTPHLVPLSFLWHGERIWLATAEHSPTVGNLRAGRRDGRGAPVRLALDGVRDVVAIEGLADLVASTEVDPAVADAYVPHCGWDPRGDPQNTWVVVTPATVRSWREANELPGRVVMRDGAWLT